MAIRKTDANVGVDRETAEALKIPVLFPIGDKTVCVKVVSLWDEGEQYEEGDMAAYLKARGISEADALHILVTKDRADQVNAHREDIKSGGKRAEAEAEARALEAKALAGDADAIKRLLALALKRK